MIIIVQGLNCIMSTIKVKVFKFRKESILIMFNLEFKKKNKNANLFFCKELRLTRNTICFKLK